MKTFTKLFYKCERCGFTMETSEPIERCEASHIKEEELKAKGLEKEAEHEVWMRKMNRASDIVETWPDWKKGVLESTNEAYVSEKRYD